MSFFKRRKKVPINVNTVDSGAPTFLPAGNYEMAWEKQRVPDPGAMVYSWETLGLSQFSPVGPGRGILQVIRSLQQPMAFYHVVPVAGMPLVPGQVVFQPLVRGSPNA